MEHSPQDYSYEYGTVHRTGNAEILPTAKESIALKRDRQLQILLVEDTRADITFMQLALEHTKIPLALTTMQRGDEALSYVDDVFEGGGDAPDLMILDLGLPGIDGFEVLAALAARPASQRAFPILILTGHQDFDYICGMFPLCIVGYVQKPCASKRLAEVLHTLIRSPHGTGSQGMTAQ